MLGRVGDFGRSPNGSVPAPLPPAALDAVGKTEVPPDQLFLWVVQGIDGEQLVCAYPVMVLAAQAVHMAYDGAQRVPGDRSAPRMGGEAYCGSQLTDHQLDQLVVLTPTGEVLVIRDFHALAPSRRLRPGSKTSTSRLSFSALGSAVR